MRYGVLLGILSQLRPRLGQIKVSGWICTLQLYASPASCPARRERYLNAPGLCLTAGQADCSCRHTYSIQTSLHKQLIQGDTKTHCRQQELLTSIANRKTNHSSLSLYSKIATSLMIWTTVTLTYESASHDTSYNTVNYQTQLSYPFQLPIQLKFWSNFLKSYVKRIMPYAHS